MSKTTDKQIETLGKEYNLGARFTAVESNEGFEIFYKHCFMGNAKTLEEAKNKVDGSFFRNGKLMLG
jgi:hypothetical protein